MCAAIITSVSHADVPISVGSLEGFSGASGMRKLFRVLGRTRGKEPCLG